MKVHYHETRQSMTPQKALAFLKEGNQRFLNNLRTNHNLLQLVNETAERQFPFAAILSCSDSRVPVELVFDQGLGDIFSVRLAGNIASINAIGSMEYACKVLGSKLVVVMGHTSCGAVKAAADNVKMENLNLLLQHIQPAVDNARKMDGASDHNEKDFVNLASKLNVGQQITDLLNNSAIIREMAKRGEVMIAGAMYDVETGKVEFLEEDQYVGGGIRPEYQQAQTGVLI